MVYKISFILFLFSAFSGVSQKKCVNIPITYTDPYCGGARPTKEIEAAAQTPKPYANKILVVVSESGKTLVVKTNSTGILKLKLKAGSYKIYEAWRYYKQAPAPTQLKDMDPECLKLEWQKETYSLKIDSKNTDILLKNEIVLHCPWAIPCLLESAKPPVPE